MPLFVCYVPGFDLRHITDSGAPHTARLLKSFPHVKIKSYPSTELLPSILTGSYPQLHGKYQVSLKDHTRHGRQKKNPSRVAELLVTTLQCAYSLMDYRFDLPGIPAWRRRSFDLTARFKFVARRRNSEVLKRIGGLDTIFDIIPGSTYRFSMEFLRLNEMVNKICAGSRSMEFLEIHSLDVIQLWYMDQPERIEDYYRHLDEFVGKLHAKCQESDVTLVLLVDRGMEKTKETMDIMAELRQADVSVDEYSFFIEPPMARFWFHTDRARSAITETLSTLPHGQLLTFRDLSRYHLEFETMKYGEIFFIADAGYMIFPHDFYNPIGNMLLGLGDWKQRPRIVDPRQRAVHGFLPNAESETGFMIVCDETCTTGTEQAEIIDVAPSLIELLGCRRPESMKGRPLFAMHSAAAGSAAGANHKPLAMRY
jgi:Type I phosphodiesterase / nucleotide pyrophosphatase